MMLHAEFSLAESSLIADYGRCRRTEIDPKQTLISTAKAIFIYLNCINPDKSSRLFDFHKYLDHSDFLQQDDDLSLQDRHIV